MNYEQALEFFLSFPRFGKKGGTHKIKQLLSKLGDPQDDLKFVHIAGTNGKGSVCGMLARALAEAGYRTGLFVSPYITDFRERVQINCELIDKELLTAAAQEVRICAEKCDLGGDSFCSFEIITAAAFLCFKRADCDIVILETGVGGLHDCTNVIKPPLCSVLTSIGLDHTEILGGTVGEIAREKSGIIKRGSPVVTAVQPLGAMYEIIKAAYASDSRVYYSSEIRLENIKRSLDGTSFVYKRESVSRDFKEVKIPLTLSLLGTFQEENARVALKTLEVLNEKGFEVGDGALTRGFKSVRNPARFEVLSKNPTVILDGAHNPNGLSALSNAVKAYLPGQRAIGLMAMMSDKDISNGLMALRGAFDILFVTGMQDNSRALAARELCKAAEKNFSEVYAEAEPETALDRAYDLARKSGKPLVICGSLYLAARLRPRVLAKLEHISPN